VKWCELYQKLELADEADQPNFDIGHFFKRMAMNEVFRFHVLHDEKRCPVPIEVIVKQVEANGDSLQTLRVKIKTMGRLPPGFRHGEYTLVMDEGESTGDNPLPDEMFEDGDAPPNELRHWK
jgi:hypothetical protein